MGTNFHWVLDIPDQIKTPTGDVIENPIDDMDPVYHIGKRSAAGMYCWDCDDTLCPGGKSQVHAGGRNDPPWPKRTAEHLPLSH